MECERNPRSEAPRHLASGEAGQPRETLSVGSLTNNYFISERFNYVFITESVERLLLEANPMAGVFQNIDPQPPSPPGECVLPPPCRGYTRGGGRGGGWSIVRKTPDTALYSEYVSTFCSRLISFQLFNDDISTCSPLRLYMRDAVLCTSRSG